MVKDCKTRWVDREAETWQGQILYHMCLGKYCLALTAALQDVINNSYINGHAHIITSEQYKYKFTHYNPFEDQGAVSIRKTVLPGMAIPMLKIRRPNGRLIFNMEIAIRI